MKKCLLVLSVLVFSKVSNAQNTYPWTSSGNVGIGTENPSAVLHTNVNSTNNINEVGLIVGRSGGIASGGVHRGVGMAFMDTNNPTFVSGIAGIRTTPGGNYNGELAFFTHTGIYNANSFADMGERMRITTNGNVGIGTTYPTSLLHLNNSNGSTNLKLQSNTFSTIDILPGDDNNYAYMNLGNGSTYGWQIGKDVNSGTLGGANGLYFYEITGGNQGTRMVINKGGNVGIGTTSPDSKLTVAGKIHSREVKVAVNAGADFVFDKEYKLRSLAETEKYISANKHLPEIASAEEMKKNGLELGEMNIKLLQKIEELTLHLIAQNKELELQGKQLNELQSSNSNLLAEVQQLKLKH